MLKINGQRLLDDLDSLGSIGRTPEGGLARLAMSAADVEGREWFRQRVEADGFDFRTDGAGNLSAILPAAQDAPAVLMGSHLDTVRNGGQFDGALGVLAGLEVLRTCRDAAITLPFNLEAISFTDEEGSILPLLGSRAVAGLITRAELEHPRGGGKALAAGMARLDITPETILASRRENLHAYLELHIEQGAVLEDAGIDIGIVTSMVGLRSYWLHFKGESAHAGTKPMRGRADALWGAAQFIGAAREIVMQEFSPGVMNTGQLFVQPGAFNIVPSDVKLALEFRHSTEAYLEAMNTRLLALAQDSARQFNLSLDIEPVVQVAPALMDEGLMQTLEAGAEIHGLTHMRLFSFAGHDAQSMRARVPAAMIFVPCVKGISHHPDEFATPEAVVNGANVLLQAIINLSEKFAGE
jgi:N-carbamoyl-L-amino-acid hydrolase